MKWLQNGNLAKLVAFFVIALIITCTVSFAANGWQSFTDNNPDSDKIVTENKNPVNDNLDENQEGNKNDNDNSVSTDVPETKYYNYITGLETDLNSSLKKPVSVVLKSDDPIYGLSSSYLTIEIPVEHGQTRLLCFMDKIESIGKIGSLAPSRGYISNIVSNFNGILLMNGCDDQFDYDHLTLNDKLDFSQTSGYCYTEYNSYVYTNGDLVNAFSQNTNINTIYTSAPTLPYLFTDEKLSGNAQSATSVILRYSDSNSTEFTYSETDKKYVFSKNGTVKKDLLNDKSPTFDNVFILYANSTTYENEDSTQMILDTRSGGKGVYITGGLSYEITWIADDAGNLVFLDENGEKLSINRGSSYICYAKSSNMDNTKIT